LPLGGYRDAGGTGNSSSENKAVENKCVLSLDLNVERESQLNRAGGNKFQVKRCGSAELRHWSFSNGYHFQCGASRVAGNALKLFF